MNDLIISSTEDSPEIRLQANGNFLIAGRSLPEDAFRFYEPVIQWIGFYSQTPSESTTIEFQLEYFNTASAKQLFKIVSMAAEIGRRKEVRVKWYYEAGDRDMKASGERFSKLGGIPFEMTERN
jgi:hypothetical protein